MRKCTVEGCTNKHAAIGLCKKHYYAKKRRESGKPERARYMENPPTSCGYDSCERPYLARGYCKLHYYRARDGVPMDAPIKHRPKSDAERRQRRKERADRYHASIRGIQYISETEMLAYWGAVCHICGESIDLSAPRKPGLPGWERGLHREHVIPVSAGGETSLENVRPAHAICNLRKGSK